MDKKNQLIYSVIIPTHDRLDLLENAIGSVFFQKILPYEIIIVDDLSQENVRKLVQKIKRKFNCKITYLVSKSKNGVSYSYNFGASKAKGKYLAFLDDDDFWGKDYISSIFKVLSKKNIDIVITSLTEYDDKFKKTKRGKCPPKKFNIENYYLQNPGILRSNIFIKRSCFELVNGYDEKIFGSSDKDLFIRLKLLNKKHYIINKSNLIFWRTNHKNQASTNSKKMLGNVKNFYKKYFFKMPLHIHLKMIIKIKKLLYLSIINK